MRATWFAMALAVALGACMVEAPASAEPSVHGIPARHKVCVRWKWVTSGGVIHGIVIRHKVCVRWKWVTSWGVHGVIRKP